MMEEFLVESLIDSFGLCPEESSHSEIKALLKEEVEQPDNRNGCGDYLLLLCFMLFSIGKAEDCELVWKAKNLNMDTGSMIDVGLLCGAGYEQTLDYLAGRPELNDMRAYLERCRQAGDEFDRDAIIENFMGYYQSEE